ncbi:hypothetical protein [Halarcobacter anaerophilus]|uniref:hypothetical protein n=1 Tax=Halarcobacter anaerophilus TaxID=877500 RepID=UPI0005C8C1F6|nr:hypothetical protein [Halarcobacter anaerophilus]
MSNGLLVNEMYGKFTQIPNIIIEDTNIKHTAFRQYCYLIGKPSGWKVRNEDICNKLGIAYSTVTDNFKNLIKNKYMDRTPCKNEKGKFEGGYNYRIFVIPTETVKNTETEKMGTGKNVGNSNTKTIKEPTNFEYLQMIYQNELEKKKKSRAYDIKPKDTKRTAQNTA